MAAFRNLIIMFLCAVMAFPSMRADHLVIVAVNDTHSQIDPASDGKGGVARRRAIYDKLRAENPNTVIIHAGDAVQGTLFFSLYKGEVEYALMDTLGYDAIILGNHEFDNGMEELAAHYRNVDAVMLAGDMADQNVLIPLRQEHQGRHQALRCKLGPLPLTAGCMAHLFRALV